MTDQFSRDVARQMAQKAASLAVSDFQERGTVRNEKQTARRSKPRRTSDMSLSRFALHTWGVLAALSLAAGMSANLAPQNDPLEFLAVSVSGPLLKANDKALPVSQTTAVAAVDPKIDAPAVKPDTAGSDWNSITSSLRLNGAIDTTVTGSVQSQPETAITAAISPTETPTSPSGGLTPVLPHAIGMAISIDSSKVVLERRYEALQRRAPALFAGLEPLVEPISKKGGTAFSLIAGPFTSSDQAAGFCRQLQLRLTLSCVPQAYSGTALQYAAGRN